MEDILEKTTIHIDSDYASFISDTEFYVDIIDDIKNCIYIKTLKTEVFVKANYPEIEEGRANEYNAVESSYVENSIFNDKTSNANDPSIIKKNVFNVGDYLYINLNDIHRINAISKKITVKTFDDISSNINDNNYGLIWTKVDKTPIDYDIDDPNNLLDYKEITDTLDARATTVKTFITLLIQKAADLGGGTTATTIEELNNIVTFTKQQYIDIGLSDYKSFLKEYNYYHETLLETSTTPAGTFRYVPTYIGYTKDNLKINKYTWNVLKNTDATVAERIKYLYNEGGASLNPMNKVYNYKVVKEEFNTLRYYDSIYINKPTIHTNLLTSTYCYILSYKQELSGTSCGPNDTNTMVLNPILPELKRFNVKLTRINELGEHIDVPITKDGVFRVIMSFTIYYKRKKVTRA
tara:strand:- start:21710 stop:22933 length:1224 start_codon:yes stop_codon:yes gene_type:complete